MSDDEKPSHLRLVTEPAWEDMGYGALPEHLRDEKPDWQVLGYSSAAERDAERFGDQAGEKPIQRFTAKKLSEANPDRTWRAPKIVAQAKCAAHKHGCPNAVDVTDDGMAALETWSEFLAKRNEAPLELNACFLCNACSSQREAAAAQRAADRRSRTTEAIRYLKAIDQSSVDSAHEAVRANLPPYPRASADEAQARARLTSLTKWLGSGYVSDLVTAIREGRKSSRSKPKAGDL